MNKLNIEIDVDSALRRIEEVEKEIGEEFESGKKSSEIIVYVSEDKRKVVNADEDKITIKNLNEIDNMDDSNKFNRRLKETKKERECIIREINNDEYKDSGFSECFDLDDFVILVNDGIIYIARAFEGVIENIVDEIKTRIIADEAERIIKEEVNKVARLT